MKLEEKINKLKEEVSKYETLEFLTFISGILLQIPSRKENPYLKNLMSPMRQLFYLGILNAESAEGAKKIGISNSEWDKMSKLLHEIEMEYFYLLGFPKNGQETKEDIEKIFVTMPTFMNYFLNGPLSYQEQEIERIQKIFEKSEQKIYKLTGLYLNDFIDFYDEINKIINNNLNRALTYLNKEKWQEFTKNCLDKGIDDPKKWIENAPDELIDTINYFKNPGSILIANLEKINYDKIDKNKFIKLINLFSFEISPNKEITYYTEKNPLMDKPVIKISESQYLLFYPKQLLNATTNYLFAICKKNPKSKILEDRDKFIEEKTFEIFEDFFGKHGKVYFNYSIDGFKHENDIIVIHKNKAIIIEVKAGISREPMRNYKNAFNKIKSDFKKIIQNGYDQTLRVKNAFFEKDELIITNKKKQQLYKIDTKRYRNNLYSIIVTLDRFGNIQTNLENMLNIDEDDDYPWSVNIDDFEAFMLTLSKNKNRINLFLSFLMSREHYHGHLICSDELELCGLFLKNKQKFFKYARIEDSIVTQANMTKPIEDCYMNGMGFKNERHIKDKKDKSIGFLYHKN